MRIIDKLQKERSTLLDKQDEIILTYRDLYLKSKQCEDTKTKKTLENQIKKVCQKYDESRESIYDIEDRIAEIDTDILDDIIEPNPEDIHEAVNRVIVKGYSNAWDGGEKAFNRK